MLQLEAEWTQQYHDLEADIQNRAHFSRVASETYRGESLILPEDRDPLDVVLRRTRALLSDLQRTDRRDDLSGCAQRLNVLVAASDDVSPLQQDVRRTVC